MQPTSSLMIRKFQRVLEEHGIPSTVRFTMGDDIDAACGQLALRERPARRGWPADAGHRRSTPAPTGGVRG